MRAWITIARWVLGLSYLFAAPAKIGGREFARAATDPAIRDFFVHLHATGPLWRLMGVAQLVAGACLLIPRTMALGELVALGVTTAIEVTLWSQAFSTTDRVAGVTLGVMQVSLHAWEHPRLRLLVPPLPDADIGPAPLSACWRRGLRALGCAAWAGFLIIGVWHYAMRHMS